MNISTNGAMQMFLGMVQIAGQLRQHVTQWAMGRDS